eukprot:TRINITY_DN74286_c0_g1_i1.p1 TRINITY_DN74286_c0_g1~~TRINITY_DN74286_c0_g1_i1.p1  ORF type:complete len:528 (+),score=88.97 TRINITY_DN74286_c0_g1_i1:51-1634(+)
MMQTGVAANFGGAGAGLASSGFGAYAPSAGGSLFSSPFGCGPFSASPFGASPFASTAGATFGTGYPGGNVGRAVGTGQATAGYMAGGPVGHLGLVGYPGMDQLNGMSQATPMTYGGGQVAGAQQMSMQGAYYQGGAYGQQVATAGCGKSSGKGSSYDGGCSGGYKGGQDNRRTGKGAGGSGGYKGGAAAYDAYGQGSQGGQGKGGHGGGQGSDSNKGGSQHWRGGKGDMMGHKGNQSHQDNKHSNLFVGNLAEGTSDRTVRDTLSVHGSVLSCRVFTQNGRTCALTKMGSVREAEKVIRHYTGSSAGPDAKGRWLVKFADADAGKAERGKGGGKGKGPKDLEPGPGQSPTNLYVKGLPPGTPEMLLHAVFVQYGNIERLRVLEPRDDDMADCAALVQFSKAEEAKAALKALNGHVLAAPTPLMRVRFAGKEQKPSSNLYVAGLPTEVEEEQVRWTFEQCGVTLRVRLLQDKGRPETHALVQMSTLAEAEEAIKTLNGKHLEGSGQSLIVRYAAEKPKEDGKDSKDRK